MSTKQPTSQKGQDIIELSEDGARAYLEGLLWPTGPVCAHCEAKDVYKMQGESIRAGLYRCHVCEKPFTVTIGTIFEDSHLPLSKWVKAVHLMCSSKKGISALQLQRNLGLGSYRTAWHMAHRIRLAMSTGLFGPQKLKGIVEVDETYVGGYETRSKMRSQSNKTPVVSLVERGGEGRKYSLVMPHVTAKNLKAAIRDNVEAGSIVNTDEASGYSGVHKEFKHETVNHLKKQYVRKFKDGHTVTTNTVVGSFSLLKRGIVGAFHHVSKEHLHRYCAEFDFRWNNRKAMDSERTREALRMSKGKRLSYKKLKGAA